MATPAGTTPATVPTRLVCQVRAAFPRRYRSPGPTLSMRLPVGYRYLLSTYAPCVCVRDVNDLFVYVVEEPGIEPGRRPSPPVYRRLLLSCRRASIQIPKNYYKKILLCGMPGCRPPPYPPGHHSPETFQKQLRYPIKDPSIYYLSSYHVSGYLTSWCASVTGYCFNTVK